MKKRLATPFLALVAAFALPLAAPAAALATSATSATIDPSRLGSITVRKYVANGDDATSGAPDAGAVFSLGRVPGLDLATPEGWLAADALADEDPDTITTEPVKRGVTDSRGEVAFRNLELGLYKVTEVASDGGAVAPFLVTIPMTDPEARDRWVYDVVAYPKATTPPPGEWLPVEEEPIYDLALRTWISEVWRDGRRVFERQSPVTDPGPDFVVPHVTFDDPTVDIHVGDLVVHDIHLFNQGNRTVRVDEIVNDSAFGLDYAHGQLMATVPGHDNAGWELADDGLWHLPDAGIVLAPGEESEVHFTLQVLPEALGTGVDVADHPSFVEISKFSGWVPVSSSPAVAAASRGVTVSMASTTTATGLATQPARGETHDGVLGTWQQVPDIDSTPMRKNVAMENGRLVYHSWEDNEVNESNTSMAWDDHLNDYDNDEDDHDGVIIQVVRDRLQSSSTDFVRLPRTGAEIGAVVTVAVVLVITGAAAVTGAVRRRRDSSAMARSDA